MPAEKRELEVPNGAAKEGSGTGVEVLDREAFFSRSKAARLRRNPEKPPIAAMYSSLVDGIVTDPELMTLPLDDHAIVRGHAIFDTATLANGRVYRLGPHLDRLFASAKDARLKLPFGPTEEENRARITDIVCRTCVASGCRDGSIRYYLSAGPGNFGITSEGCEPAFYCVVYGIIRELAKFEAVDEVLVRSVPMKPPLLARVKSNNYMLNSLTAMAAKDHGGRFGILVHGDDTIAEGCIVNAAFVTADRTLVTPPFDNILAGTTVRKAMELARKHLIKEGGLLREVRQETVPVATAFAAVEVMLLAGDTHLVPIKSLDGKQVGDGKPGPVATELHRLLLQEAEQGEGDHIELKY
mmetsp:Transcript_20526/g.57740  ORF Transcript_20526/g.57740 Transcript_20526/m.57740 type:complete len:355 (+) Transcript_20526:79-1143(+)